MSIAARIENMNNNLKNAYDSLENLGVDLENTNKNLENLSSKIDSLYNELPKITGEGAEITLTPTRKGRMQLDLKGNTSQDSYQGYNLIDTSLYQEETKNGVTLTKDKDGNIILNGTSTSGFGWNVNLPETRILPAGTYTKSITKDSNIGTYLTVSIGYNGSSISETSIQPSRGINTMTFEQDTNYDQVRMYITNNTTFDNYKLSYMILLGEYTAQTIPTYEPCTGGVPSPNPEYPQNIHVVTGNNTIEIIGKNKIPTQKNMWESGHYDINGNKGTYASRMRLINLLKIKPNTTYKIKNKALIIRAFDINQTFLRDIGLKTPDSTFTTSEDCYYLAISTDITYTDYNETSNKLSLFLNTETDITWEPYYHVDYPINLGSLELCKIGNYQDYLYKENGKWYKRQIIKSKIYTDNNNFQLGSASTDNYYVFQTHTANSIIIDAKTNGNSLVCDNFVFHNYEDNLQEEYVAINPSAYAYIRFHIASNRLNEKSVNAFKEWLQTHNVLLYYILENEITTQITNETLISQLDAIEKAKSNEGQTSITQINADLPFIINATALLKND